MDTTYCVAIQNERGVEIYDNLLSFAECAQVIETEGTKGDSIEVSKTIDACSRIIDGFVL